MGETSNDVSNRFFFDEYLRVVWTEILEEVCNKNQRKGMMRKGVSHWKMGA